MSKPSDDATTELVEIANKATKDIVIEFGKVADKYNLEEYVIFDHMAVIITYALLNLHRSEMGAYSLSQSYASFNKAFANAFMKANDQHYNNFGDESEDEDEECDKCTEDLMSDETQEKIELLKSEIKTIQNSYEEENLTDEQKEEINNKIKSKIKEIFGYKSVKLVSIQ